MSKLKIRAHHGLCIRFFQSEGYSDDFTKNMTTVIEKLQDNPLVTIVKSIDVICAKCPRNHHNLCLDSDKVCRYDKMVLNFCNLQENVDLRWYDYQKMITEEIMEKGKFSIICNDCHWRSICHK